jgi:hypothetical protein
MTSQPEDESVLHDVLWTDASLVEVQVDGPTAETSNATLVDGRRC